MRPIHKARLDKTRPVLVLTRELARPAMASVTVAPITSTVRGLSTEVPVGPANGLANACAVSCDNIQTIPASVLGEFIGFLGDEQEPALAEAICKAFDLDT
ncbi:type II toxin-antitoxin system PemK/MazF family toxin [Mycobacterium sp. TNTM28]|uniref:Type II toxin-antitoxin system PemK/MazF family toxin n=1 Tax=[Mycobacterium] fortunisiensis TaxID=2600579 RepID=A0ABS6KSC4_9MYCO|nr:type II toxin-antitoxin system PemK/MazF family toxin [[Mycobacterium] fortunisiensis]MBU9766472.1 type II toxin-antitoxin system PemK/MazF family toxin [[Mycobacterium] fortunisiensis]